MKRKTVIAEFAGVDNALHSIHDSDNHEWDIELIGDSYWRYCSGGGYVTAPTEPDDATWVDWKFFEDRGEKFTDEFKAGFLQVLPVFDDETEPMEYCHETDDGFCFCKYCGTLLDENMSMCHHLTYMREGTDSYAGCGNDDYRYVRYAWRFIPFKADVLQEIKDKSLSFGYRNRSILPQLLAEISGCDGDSIEHDDYHEQMQELYSCEISEDYFDGIHRGLVFLASIPCKEFREDEKSHAELVTMLESLNEEHELAHRPMMQDETRVPVLDDEGKVKWYQVSHDYWGKSVPHEMTMPKFIRKWGEIEVEGQDE